MSWEFKWGQEDACMDRGGTKRRLIIDKEIDQVNYIKYNGSQDSHLQKGQVQEEKKTTRMNPVVLNC